MVGFPVVMLVFFGGYNGLYAYVYIYTNVYDMYALMVDSVRFVYTCIYIYILYQYLEPEKTVVSIGCSRSLPWKNGWKSPFPSVKHVCLEFRPESWQLRSFKEKLCS